jgi:outer membrane receptor protein involved in Fe transport
MRLPTQILLLGAILTNGARATITAPAVEPTAAPKPAATALSDASDSEVVRLEPVRVTADIWETPLEKISASVSVYDGERLASEGARHFGDLANQIPNLTFTGGSSRPRYFQIRGIGENSQFEGETPDSAVRFVVDDLDFTGIGTIGSTFDVGQVEVLRGPQAGAFGANAAGGVIRLVTNDPTPYWTGVVEGSAGEDNLREGGFAVGGPLLENDPEKLMVRLAVQQHASDGFRKNVFLGRDDTNARDELLARLKVTFNANESWRWDATAFFADADNGYDEFALDNNGTKTFSDEPGFDTQRSRAGSLRGTYSGSPDVRFTTVSSGTWTDSNYAYDNDWAAPGAYWWFTDLARERRTLAQELRFDSALEEDALGWIDRWTVGAYFSRLEEDSVWSVFDTGAPLFRQLTDYEADNVSLFGQIAHDITSRTRVILGLRVERVDQRSAVDSDDDGAANFTPRFDDTLFGGKLTLEHDLAESRVVFASVARGYKAGGVSVDPNIDPLVDPLTFESETLWNYEAGVRGGWFDGRVTGELTAFYLMRSDTQVRGSDGNAGAFRYYTDNGGDSEVYGLESAFTYRFADAWTLHGSLALMQSERDGFTPSNPANPFRPSRELAATPSYGYTIGVRYRAPRGWFGNLELVGRDEYFESDGNDEKRDAYAVVNGSLGYAWREWTVSMWARNLLDEAYAKRVFNFDNGFGAQRYESRADPRQLGVSAAYRF